jgi:hypothetical protein
MDVVCPGNPERHGRREYCLSLKSVELDAARLALVAPIWFAQSLEGLMPFVEGETGWAVLRPATWKFVALFPSKEAAEERARELGPDYVVKFGEYRVGSDDFIYGGQFGNSN